MKFYIVDAFTSELFGGNPAGVAILGEGEDFPDVGIMLKTAAELRYSETVFVKRTGEKEFDFRYFTPTDEVDLCGHATIGAFGCLMEAKTVMRGCKYFILTKAGRLEIEIKDDIVFMEMGRAVELEAALDIPELAAVLGLSMEEISGEPRLISTGLPDVIVPVRTKNSLMRIKPDFERMLKMSERLKAAGVHAFALSGEDGIKAFCRNFAPLYGIDEEAATGTANGALTYYLYKEKLTEQGEINTFIQGESMGRPSRIFTIIDQEEPTKIRVGGSCKILAEGELFI